MRTAQKIWGIVTTAALLSACGSVSAENITMEGEKVQSRTLTFNSSVDFNNTDNNNPLISEIFCADPTAVEYNGRLYVYGTNDHQQYEAVGADGSNTYEHIKSLVMLSTDDMVNWTYHGIIDVGEISPWAIASWAPSVVSRVEEDGKTHFYLYYSNSGWGVGVLTAESPVGPWSDPLGRSIIDGNTEGLNGCKSPFDPGVVIDDNGTGWLSFGGGEDSARIVKLGADMISLDSEIAVIPSEHHFEASELNYINGTYVYTYNNDWNAHGIIGNVAEVAPGCSMGYLVSQTPLDTDSWVYKGYYFKNPGEQGMEYSNNHTHLQKYCGRYYLFYHSLFPQYSLGTDGGFRSLCVNEATVNEETVSIEKVNASKAGVEQIKSVDPYSVNQAETACVSHNLKYTQTKEEGNLTVSSDNGWFSVKGADMGNGAALFSARAKGDGEIFVFADGDSSQCIAALKIESDDFTVSYCKALEKLSGEHDLYFYMTGSIEFDEWQFV